MPICKKCWKTYYNPYVATSYCSKQCEESDGKNNKAAADIINELFWKFNKEK